MITFYYVCILHTGGPRDAKNLTCVFLLLHSSVQLIFMMDQDDKDFQETFKWVSFGCIFKEDQVPLKDRSKRKKKSKKESLPSSNSKQHIKNEISGVEQEEIHSDSDFDVSDKDEELDDDYGDQDVGNAVENDVSSEEEEEDQGLTLLGSIKVGKDGESLNKKVKKKKKKKRSQEETLALQHEEGVNRLRNEHKLKVWSNADDSKGKVAEPMQSFGELGERYGMGEDLLANISKAGYKVPTPVQMQAIPAMIEGCQLLACAPTGSGKTAAFLLPVIHQLGVPKGGGVRAVLVSPTRELAQQTHRECLRLAEGRRLRIHLLSKVKAAAKRIGPKGSHKIDILITTPNRLIYLLNQEPVGICLKNVEWLVVDESDKLFEEGKQGFRDQLAHIYQACDGSKVRRAMFSATHTAPVAGWCRKNLTDLVCVNVGVRNTAVETVKQTLQFVGNEDGKLLQFRNMVREGMPTPVLLFVQTKDRAQQLFQELIYDGINVDVIHAGRTQQQRDNTVRCFREGKIWVLICTELMARGIDFIDVSLVINYDFPPSTISYIHRIGRTGRAGKSGQAVTFFTLADMKYLRSIAQVLVDSGCEVPEYILKLDKTNKTDRKELAAKAPKRKAISTEPVFDRVKREKIRNAIKRRKKREEGSKSLSKNK